MNSEMKPTSNPVHLDFTCSLCKQVHLPEIDCPIYAQRYECIKKCEPLIDQYPFWDYCPRCGERIGI